MWEVSAHCVIPEQVVLGYRRNQAEHAMSPLSHRRWPGMCKSYKPFSFQDALVTVFVAAVGNKRKHSCCVRRLKRMEEQLESWETCVQIPVLQTLTLSGSWTQSLCLNGLSFLLSNVARLIEMSEAFFTLHVLIYNHTYIIHISSC